MFSHENHTNNPQEREGKCPGLCPSRGLYMLAVLPRAMLWDNPNYRAFSSTSLCMLATPAYLEKSYESRKRDAGKKG